jgi:hypothetical protein
MTAGGEFCVTGDKWAHDNPAWAIAVQCRRCIHSGMIYPGELRHPYARRVGDLKAPLYCPKCDGHEFWLTPAFLYRKD